jgi:hypothetical protein
MGVLSPSTTRIGPFFNCEELLSFIAPSSKLA